MEGLRIAFLVVAGISAIINLTDTIFKEKNKGVHFNAFCGWTCAILYAIP